jgi:molybdopterin converting factor subunit 1
VAEDLFSVDVAAFEFYPFGEGLPPSLFFAFMQIRVLFFASYRDLVGTPELTLAFQEGSTVSQLVEELRGRGGGLERIPPVPAVALNEEYVAEDALLRDGDVVAFIPPVAGG